MGCRWRWRRAIPDKLAKLAEETAGATFACEATEPEEVAALFEVVIATQGVPDIVVYNASARARGPVTELDPEAVARAISVSAYGGFLVAQQAARHMVARGSGAILLTGASASVKGIRIRRRSRWASSRCAGWRRAWRGSCRRRACMWRISSSTAGSAARPGRTRTTSRQHAGSGRDCGDVLAGGEPAAQRLDLGGGAAALGGEVLRVGLFILPQAFFNTESAKHHEGARRVGRQTTVSLGSMM